tara:strand:+ start:8468 stop:9214 length:747 start_codon:yes stop_codon:yes gene_type:complete
MSEIYVISTGRNPNHLLYNCVYSIRSQILQPKEHILIDDLSDDNTADLISRLPKYDNLTIIQNTERKYRLKNIYDHAIDKNPEDIIVLVDTDDYLSDVAVLDQIRHSYDANPAVEYIYSKYLLADGTPGGSREIPGEDWNPYTGSWITSHLCTFKAKALQGISIENFLDWNCEWFKIATDHALILPVIHRLKQKTGDYSAIGFINRPTYMHTFHGNPSKPRAGTPEADARSDLAVKCSTYIKQRGYIE